MGKLDIYAPPLLGYGLQSPDGAAWLAGSLITHAFTDRRARAVFNSISSLVHDGIAVGTTIQKIRPDGGTNREREISQIADSIETVGITLNVAQLAISQLNEEGKARESRAIEMHADAFLRLDGERDQRTIELVCSRNGEPGAIEVLFDGSKQLFKPVTKIYSDPEKFVEPPKTLM